MSTPTHQSSAEEDESKWAYDFIQDVLFWYGNAKSAHYRQEEYGSSFNTHAFCKEYAAKLAARDRTKAQELLARVEAEGPKNLIAITDNEKLNYEGFNDANNQWRTTLAKIREDYDDKN